MKGQPNRLVFDGTSPFGGAEIDRSRPLRFRLNGMTIAGFAGDTVLSAALAAGIDTVGQFRDWPMALSQTLAPAIIAVDAPRDDLGRAMPMARVPATDGADYRTLGVRKRRVFVDAFERFKGPSRTLGVDLDSISGLERPWLSAAASAVPAVDLVVVGSGVAGLSAALTGAKAGLSVILLESCLQPGGNARLFGTQDGEEAPDQTIGRLRAAVQDTAAITVRLNAEAFAVRRGMVRAMVIEQNGASLSNQVLDFACANIVLATGTIEQLPIFPGNRLPGVVGVAEAHALAYRHAVWPGRKAALATVSSPAYRLTMQAKDAGINIVRVLDGRPDPQSRFVAFSKAYGITMAAGTVPASAQTAANGRGIALTSQVSIGDVQRDEPGLVVDRLLVCGGWQPDLTLWHMAGGQSEWSDAAARIEPRGQVPGIALAGSAAGYQTRKACLASGEAAVAQLLGQRTHAVADVLIDPIHETPDGPAPSAERRDGQAPAYLGNGLSLLDRPLAQASRWPAWLPFVPRSRGWQLAETPHPLEVTDISAGVRLGAIPADSAGIVAQERVAMVALNVVAPDEPVAAIHYDGAMPAFLAGRFGGHGALWIVASTDKRHLDTGALIYRDADDSDPALAIGVVVRHGEGAAMALLGGGTYASDMHLSLRDGGRIVGIRLVSHYRQDAASAPTLGGEAGPA